MTRYFLRTDERGFTLGEVMVVVAIVGILASISIASYWMFTTKAKTVEAETALHEVNRLETLYYDARGQFSSDLQAIGFAPPTRLKYYNVAVQLTPDSENIAYRVTATPIGNVYNESWMLTRYQDGNMMLEKFSGTPIGTVTGPILTGDGLDSVGNSSNGPPSNNRGPGTVNQSPMGSLSNRSTMNAGNTGLSQVGTNASAGQ